jgi:hypothetical protein
MLNCVQVDLAHDEMFEGELYVFETASDSLPLDLTKGKPSPQQLDLSAELFNLPGMNNFIAEGAIDIRNYGGQQGLLDAHRLFSILLEPPPHQISWRIMPASP